MSILSTLSIKEEYKNEYTALRNWLNQKDMSQGDYMIQKWREQFNSEVLTKKKK